MPVLVRTAILLASCFEVDPRSKSFQAPGAVKLETFMLQRCSVALLFAASLLPAPLAAADCNLTSAPTPMLAGGLAEPLGDLVLRCSFGAPGSALQGMLILGVDEKLANQVDDQGHVLGITVSVGDTLPVQLPGTTASSQNGQAVLISGIDTSFDALGEVTLRVGGLRAATAAKVQAGLGLAGTPYLNIHPPLVTAGYSVGSFLTTTPDTLLQPNYGGLAGLDLSAAIAKMDPNLTVRVTESDWAAFHPKLGLDTTGTRISVRFPGFPQGSRVFAPDAIAGSNAETPTTSGWFGTAANPGSYVLSSPAWPTFLLVRVQTPSADGSGGRLAWQPVAGSNSLAGSPIREADYLPDGSPYFIYEVLDANPLIQESAQIPLYAFAGATPDNWPIAVRAALRLEPVPAAGAGTAAGLTTIPTPRYSGAATTGPDCTLLLDCAAKWFPELRVQPNSAPTRVMPSDSSPRQGFLALTNVGGGVALWTASVEYGRRLGGWLRLAFTTGAIADRIGLTYSFAPIALRPGMYQANIVFTQTNAPDGSRPSVSQPVELIVRPLHPVERKPPAGR